MQTSHERRVSLASCWASTRMRLLDAQERYEDSYAITQEFREWITCAGEHPEQLKDSFLVVPTEQESGTDEMLEI